MTYQAETPRRWSPHEIKTEGPRVDMLFVEASHFDAMKAELDRALTIQQEDERLRWKAESALLDSQAASEEKDKIQSWQPIETAKYPCLVRFERHSKNSPIFTVFYEYMLIHHDDGWNKPTHWMPIPELPKEKP